MEKCRDTRLVGESPASSTALVELRRIFLLGWALSSASSSDSVPRSSRFVRFADFLFFFKVLASISSSSSGSLFASWSRRLSGPALFALLGRDFFTFSTLSVSLLSALSVSLRSSSSSLSMQRWCPRNCKHQCNAGVQETGRSSNNV